jgi:hypothetical protein
MTQICCLYDVVVGVVPVWGVLGACEAMVLGKVGGGGREHEPDMDDGGRGNEPEKNDGVSGEDEPENDGGGRGCELAVALEPVFTNPKFAKSLVWLALAVGVG